MQPVVRQVSTSGDYRLNIVFANGESGTLDMAPYLEFGVFTRLKDKAEFSRVKVSFDTLEWPCGVDLDPEFVYQKTVKTA